MLMNNKNGTGLNRQLLSDSTLLIVDDNPENLGVLESFFSEYRCKVVIATSGESALKRLNHVVPDIILLDVILPGINGFETCEIIKEKEEYSDIPVVFMSALTETEDKTQGFKVGAVDFITKPLNKDEVLTRVNTHLTIAKQRIVLEAAVQEKNQELINSNNLFRQISDNIEDVFWIGEVTDCESYTLLFVSKAFETIWQRTPEEVCQDSSIWINALYPDDKERIAIAFTDFVTGNSDFDEEYRIVRPDETVRTVFVKGTIVHKMPNGIIRITGIVKDITESKQLQEQIAQSRKMDAIGRLAGGVAHDFNNLLSGIMGATQILQKRITNKKESDLLHMILKATNRAADLTSKLLTFGRKNVNINIHMNVENILSETISMMERTIDKKNSITLNNTCKNPICKGDSTALQNAIINLIINSSHAMPSGGRIQLSSKNVTLDQLFCAQSLFGILPGDYIDIEVKDEGVGIPHEYIDRVFEPFFTTKNEGEGTGLGLASVFATITNCKGAIELYSKEGVGTSFHLYLPVQDGTVEQNIQSDIYNVTFKGTILLVDDDELIRVTCQDLLEDMGFDVVSCDLGSEAIDIFKANTHKFDLIITDLNMPQMSGDELFYALKKYDPEVKVILSSGLIDDRKIKLLLENGLAGYIQKPFLNDSLKRIIAQIIHTH